MKNFADRLISEIDKKGSSICVGLDPRLSQIPGFIVEKYLEEHGATFAAAGGAILEFNKGIIEAVKDLVPCVKPQIAFYEQYGIEGLKAFQETCDYAKKAGLIVIVDAKRNDIGSTAEAYANAFLGKVDVFGKEQSVFNADALTVNGYLGFDGIKPFAEACKKYEKGIFVLIKTSNPSSGDLQDRTVDGNYTLYEMFGHLLESWGADEIGEKGYSSIGAVVGATYSEQAKKLRKIMPNTIFLVPGYGAQGGDASDIKPCYNEDGYGAIVNSSRGIIFAYEGSKKFKPEDYKEAAREATLDMKKDLKSVEVK